MAGAVCRDETGQSLASEDSSVNRYMLIALAVGISLVLIALASRTRIARHVESVSCCNSMSSLCFGIRVWLDDNTNYFPESFQPLSNELSTTKILICPGDHQRQASKEWNDSVVTNSSYELVSSESPVGPDTVVLRCKIHGHVGYADGTVFDGKRRRTKLAW
jgi:hypothetical protein